MIPVFDEAQINPFPSLQMELVTLIDMPYNVLTLLNLMAEAGADKRTKTLHRRISLIKSDVYTFFQWDIFPAFSCTMNQNLKVQFTIIKLLI